MSTAEDTYQTLQQTSVPRLMFYFNTNKPQFFFFWRNTSCIRKPQVISGEGADPLMHPPPRSTPVIYSTSCINSGQETSYEYFSLHKTYQTEC